MKGKRPLGAKILVCSDLSHHSSRDFLCGVMRFLRDEHGFSAELLLSAEELDPKNISHVLRRPFDGIVTTEFDDPNISKALTASRLPLVIVGTRKGRGPAAYASPVSLVTVDERKLGRTGAEHLLSLGNIRSFGFVPFSSPTLSHVSALRQKSFEGILHRHNRRPSVFNGATASDLEAWLRQLARPAAVLTAGVERGCAVLDACRNAGIRVPADISVLTIGNDETICESTVPPLSGIEPSMEEEGHLALLEMKHLLLDRGKCQGRTVIAPTSARVIERRSTAAIPPATHIIVRALAYIDEHADKPIGVKDVVRHLGISRRLADLRFHEFQNQTINETILERRFALLKERLSHSKKPIGQIVAELGWKSFASASASFTRRFGTSMRRFRKTN